MSSKRRPSEESSGAIEKFSTLIAQFLAKAVRHSEGWRKACVSHREDQKGVFEVHDRLRKKGLLYLLQKHAGRSAGTQYRCDNPQSMSLVAEEFDQRRHFPESTVEQSLSLIFTYRKNGGNNFKIVLHMPAGQSQISSYIYDDMYAGVGYEGHDQRKYELPEEDLGNFYDLLEQLAQEEQRKSPTEHLRDAVAQRVENELRCEEKKS
ncbi:hypothetical protein HYT95_00715 [Candidatus Peregrinibacteria bacterium]|nr:hypothetical protein [Candidatus Peregrinibacteria bacterium]